MRGSDNSNSPGEIREEHQDDLIAARATPGGAGALAIVRLDGAGVESVVRRMFRPAGAEAPTDHPRMMIFGRWVDPQTGEVIDEGLAAYFRRGHSYTGNALAEFYCHGGPVLSRRLIEAAQSLGARMADPGEFTRRAFLNGRMDLTQAEAVADLINAQTDVAARLARGQLAGSLSQRIDRLRETLIVLAAEIEARLDFPDEEIDPEDRRRLAGMFEHATAEIANLLRTRRQGRLFREGARVALVGRPNAGKSSLLNALARMERAIVTPHAGTTRDTIECTIDLRGVPLTLIDTAGLRQATDPVERLGVERTLRTIEQADLVVRICDLSVEADAAGAPQDESEAMALEVRPPDLTVFNKVDLAAEAARASIAPMLGLSALTGEGLEPFEDQLIDRLLAGAAEESQLAVNQRHGELLERAARSLAAARQGFDQDLSGEFVMVDLREALEALSTILGLELGEAVLDRVFSSFCIGK